MNEQTILIIDDSATIRRLVDRTLTGLGYRVLAASTAEDGLDMLREMQPDLILLDHQLPGTTGTEVARSVLKMPEANHIPIVVSSTLRKRAYSEYMDLPNVVDMLPKPYTEDLLNTTVENAVRTAAMVVRSQEEGAAVPEVIQQAGDPHLSGAFDGFRLREVLDFLNNAHKNGLLEVEAVGFRVFIFLMEGRIAGISAGGLAADDLVSKLPPALENLAPVVNLTLGGRGGAELEGLVELLNKKVIDPRLLRQLLRFQAAQLLWKCFDADLQEFRFTRGVAFPPLFEKLPLNVSVLALLIEGALSDDASSHEEAQPEFAYLKATLRGQNLDRAGVAAQHMKILTLLHERRTAADVSTQVGISEPEARRVLTAMKHAELVEETPCCDQQSVVTFETDPRAAQRWRELMAASPSIENRVVSDRFTLQLLLRRAQTQAFLFSSASDESLTVATEVQNSAIVAARQAKKVFLLSEECDEETARHRLVAAGIHFDALLSTSLSPDAFCHALSAVLEDEESTPTEPEASSAYPFPHRNAVATHDPSAHMSSAVSG